MITKIKKDPLLAECTIDLFDIIFKLKLLKDDPRRVGIYSHQLCHYLFLYKYNYFAHRLASIIPLVHEKYLKYFTILFFTDAKYLASSSFEALGYTKSMLDTKEEVLVKGDESIHIIKESEAEDVLLKFSSKKSLGETMVSIKPWLFCSKVENSKKIKWISKIPHQQEHFINTKQNQSSKINVFLSMIKQKQYDAIIYITYRDLMDTCGWTETQLKGKKNDYSTGLLLRYRQYCRQLGFGFKFEENGITIIKGNCSQTSNNIKYKKIMI